MVVCEGVSGVFLFYPELLVVCLCNPYLHGCAGVCSVAVCLHEVFGRVTQMIAPRPRIGSLFVSQHKMKTL